MIKVSEQTKQKLRDLLKDKDKRTWGIIIPDQAGTYTHLPLMELKNIFSPESIKIVEDLTLILETSPDQQIKELSLDYIDGGLLSGVFEVKVKKVQNHLFGPDLDDPTVQKIVNVLENEINPSIAMHGGTAQLLDYRDNIVYLQMGGGCQGCSGVDATLRQGIETRLREVVPEIAGVMDQTDHAEGKNPYFRP